MAKNYAILPMDVGEGKVCIDRKAERAYISGANAVLEEIEKALDLGEPPYLISVEQAYYRAESLIRELKGNNK